MRIVAKRGFPVILLLVGMALGFFLAAQWVPSVSAVPRQDYESLEAFTNILSIVKKNYVEDVDTKNLVNGAINGMLSSLDPHSAYLTPELYKELQMDTQGRFGGLGIEITVKDGILTVVSPIEDTPAAKAGVKPGDQIFKIENEFTKDMTLVDAVKKMRGPKGTKISISVKREGVPELINFTLMRDTIRVQSVRSRTLEEGYGYGSASASEIVAGALQDHKRAVVLGTKTFGKRSVQTILPLDDSSALRLTKARYFTPKGRSIQAMGIVPDIIVESAPPQEGKVDDKKRPSLREENLPGHLQNQQQTPNPPPQDQGDNKEKEIPSSAPTGDDSIDNDVQLKRALDLLKSWDVFKQLVQKKAA